ncbi:anti-sigma factor domain-containing protein [Terriglobus aquaticus]|uniref:Anti-sigma factor domain-containing protein n=1 Tax=Terriglobus aquaticus TaxID=940139 RepID=A0ABW9KML8_9BACT|nr:anti-sigma factor [Terriglobus aquaticus]
MIDPTITAEDLVLYALGLLEGEEQTQVETMLRKSTAAREELANIRGDLALFAMGAEQHTPPALTRQRLLKQVARERRTVPVDVPVQDRVIPEPHTFRMDRDAPNGDRESSRKTPAPALPQRRETMAPDPLDDPSPYPGPVIKPLPTRTFPRQQQVVTPSQPQTQPPAARRLREVQAASPDHAGDSFSASGASFAADPSLSGAERQTFSPDPQVFPREARSMATSSTAHSVTMFEQHFAADGTKHKVQPDLPPDPEPYTARRPDPLEALESVQDTFVASAAAREDNFGFSAYRDREADEPRGSGVARWMGWAGWSLAAAVTVAAVFALRDDFNLREQVSQQQTALSAAEASASRSETVLQTLQSASTQHFQLAATDAAPTPNGRVAYLPERGTLVFQGSNLETLQPYKTYELWLIPVGQGRQPVPAGLFKPDAHGYATVVLPPLPKGLVAANFGVTIEDDGGSSTPTLPILLVGQQS